MPLTQISLIDEKGNVVENGAPLEVVKDNPIVFFVKVQNISAERQNTAVHISDKNFKEFMAPYFVALEAGEQQIDKLTFPAGSIPNGAEVFISTELGKSGSVTITILDVFGSPVSGIPVEFGATLEKGTPNERPYRTTIVTDSSGRAVWTRDATNAEWCTYASSFYARVYETPSYGGLDIPFEGPVCGNIIDLGTQKLPPTTGSYPKPVITGTLATPRFYEEDKRSIRVFPFVVDFKMNIKSMALTFQLMDVNRVLFGEGGGSSAIIAGTTYQWGSDSSDRALGRGEIPNPALIRVPIHTPFYKYAGTYEAPSNFLLVDEIMRLISDLQYHIEAYESERIFFNSSETRHRKDWIINILALDQDGDRANHSFDSRVKVSYTVYKPDGSVLAEVVSSNSSTHTVTVATTGWLELSQTLNFPDAARGTYRVGARAVDGSIFKEFFITF